MTLPSSGGDTHRYSGWLPAASNWQPRHRPQASPVASTCSHSRLRIHASANATLPMPAGPVSSRSSGRRPLRRRADSFSHCPFCHGSNLPDIAAKLTKYLTQLRLHLVEGARGVDQPKSRGLALGPPQICRPHALETRELLALETIALAAACAAAGLPRGASPFSPRAPIIRVWWVLCPPAPLSCCPFFRAGSTRRPPP